jgi:hypothetical protein
MPGLKSLLAKLSQPRACVLLVDSSALKSYGCLQWLRFQHKIKTQNRWIKGHISLDADFHEVISYETSSSSGSEAKTLDILLEQTPKSVKEVIADGAYDTQNCREAIAKRGASARIRPRKGSLLQAKT